ncbi:MAG: hypothetical protein WD740_07275 [Anaerolineales bacterium]
MNILFISGGHSGRNWFILAIIAVVAFILFAYLFGLIPDFFAGEEYDKIRYPAIYNHIDSWTTYFNEKGRPIEGIYWTYMYEVLSYQPKIFHLFSLLIHFFAVLLTALAFTRVLKKGSYWTWEFGFVFLIFFFNPFSLHSVFRISLDAPGIALITFMGSVLCFQNYAMSQLRGFKWLLASIFLFFLTIFNYEVAAFLFPVALLLSWPFINSETKVKSKRIAIALITGGTLSCFAVLIPFQVYSQLQQTSGLSIANPAMSMQGKPLLPLIQPTALMIFSYLRNIGNGLFAPSSWQLIILRSLIVIPFFSGLIIVLRAIGKNKTPLLWIKHKFQDPRAMTFLGSIWIIIFGSLPFALIGYRPESIRAYSATIFGILAMGALVTLFQKRYKIIKVVGTFILVGSIFVGLSQYFTQAKVLQTRREFYYQYFINFANTIPGLKERTTLVFADHTVGSLSGCPGMFQVLYQTEEIWCGFLSKLDSLLLAERFSDSINFHYGGWSRYGNEVLIALEENYTPVILNQVTQRDGYLINWFDNSPISTDFRRITDHEAATNSPMYKYLIENFGQ